MPSRPNRATKNARTAANNMRIPLKDLIVAAPWQTNSRNARPVPSAGKWSAVPVEACNESQKRPATPWPLAVAGHSLTRPAEVEAQPSQVSWAAKLFKSAEATATKPVDRTQALAVKPVEWAERMRIQKTFIDFNVDEGAESALSRCPSAPDLSGPTTVVGTIEMGLRALTKHCGDSRIASELAREMMFLFRPVNASRREEGFWQSVEHTLKKAVSQSAQDPDFSGRTYHGHSLPCLFRSHWPFNVSRSPWEGVIDMFMWKFAREVIDSTAPIPQFLLQGGLLTEYMAVLKELKDMSTNPRAKAKAKVRHVDTAEYYRRLLDHKLSREQLQSLIVVAFGNEGLVSGALSSQSETSPRQWSVRGSDGFVSGALNHICLAESLVRGW